MELYGPYRETMHRDILLGGVFLGIVLELLEAVYCCCLRVLNLSLSESMMQS